VEGERLEAILQRADGASRDLSVLRPALDLLERESFTSAPLADLQAGLRQSQGRASVAIRSLARYVEMHDWAHNIVFTPIAAVLMWNTHVAWAIERWRGAHGAHVANWLRIVGEFEALASLAAYSYEHPADPLPTVVEPARPAGGAAAILIGEALGHPLLPASQMIPNDVRLDDTTQLLVISGSNMSGKSTLLRTVGINAVLALAGAPVRATKLEISPLAIGATLRIQDSLQQGRSRFFAEITRIRDIAALATTQPLLFLLDELFHGTNSHDRLVGATGVVRNLVDRGAIGLITTHDLALTAITRDLGARAANVHFEDTFDGAEMRFDYRMKAGPVTRSNAIALMRAVGLDVREDQA
jgi:DNA mismatch repair ATPase MutS